MAFIITRMKCAICLIEKAAFEIEPFSLYKKEVVNHFSISLVSTMFQQLFPGGYHHFIFKLPSKQCQEGSNLCLQRNCFLLLHALKAYRNHRRIFIDMC